MICSRHTPRASSASPTVTTKPAAVVRPKNPEAVGAECLRGDPLMVARRRSFLRDTAHFPLTERILELARLLVTRSAVPENAAHIAAAAVEKCEYLLTWNLRHVANAGIRREVERFLAKHGYDGTTICTPEELM